MTRKPRGRLVVISAPSGAGKTTLVRELLDRNPTFKFSISYTTRAPRPGEVPGRDYIFVTELEFNALRNDGEMLESACVFDNWYGTSRRQVERERAEGHNVILEIDWQGARQVRAAMPGSTSIFVLPPSVAALRERLIGRRTDSQAVIERRLADSLEDLSHWHEFDYFVVNDDLDRAAFELEGIALGRLRRNRVNTLRARRIVDRILQNTAS